AGGQDLLVTGHHQRVLGRGVEFQLAGLDRAVERIPRDAVDLRQAAEAERILDRARAARIVERRALQQAAEPLGRLDLPGRGARTPRPAAPCGPAGRVAPGRV